MAARIGGGQRFARHCPRRPRRFSFLRRRSGMRHWMRPCWFPRPSPVPKSWISGRDHRPRRARSRRRGSVLSGGGSGRNPGGGGAGVGDVRRPAPAGKQCMGRARGRHDDRRGDRCATTCTWAMPCPTSGSGWCWSGPSRVAGSAGWWAPVSPESRSRSSPATGTSPGASPTPRSTIPT